MPFLLIFLCFLSFNTHSQNWFFDEINKRQTHIKPQGFFKTHSVLFFYGSTCPHCHRFAPLLKAWANNSHAHIEPISFDNAPLKEFPNFKPANAMLVNKAFGNDPITYPAVFIFNPKTLAIYPVCFGAMGKSEFSLRIESLIGKIKKYEGSL